MIDIGPFRMSQETAALAFVAVVWLLTLLIAIVAPAGKSTATRFRRCDVLAIITTIAFGAAWSVVLLRPSRASAATSVAVSGGGTGASCASVQVGQTEEQVRERLGPPAEIRDEQDLRGPGAAAFLYPSSRCAVRLFDGKVESVE